MVNSQFFKPLPSILSIVICCSFYVKSEYIHGEPKKELKYPSVETAAPGPDSIAYMKTNNGVKFGVWGHFEPGHRKPLLIMMASSIEETLGSVYFRQCASKLVEHDDWICVSLDLPYHGSLIDKYHPIGLKGWAYAIENDGEDIVQFNNKRLKSILNYLIELGGVDERHIIVAGTSRGGYLALHYAAYDKRAFGVIAYAPVTNLLTLEEFNSLPIESMPSNLNLYHKARRLSKINIWATIGDNDQRVGTGEAVKLFDSIKQLSRGSDISLHVLPSKGHTTPAGALEMSYDWIIDKYKN